MKEQIRDLKVKQAHATEVHKPIVIERDAPNAQPQIYKVLARMKKINKYNIKVVYQKNVMQTQYKQQLQSFKLMPPI